MKRLRYLFSMILLVATLLAAGQNIIIDKVCKGATRRYQVWGAQGSIYTWLMYNSSGAEIALPNTVAVGGRNFTEADTDGKPMYKNEIVIQWNFVGVFKLKVIQQSVENCDTTDQGFVEVFEPPTVVAGKPLSICADEKVYLNTSEAYNYSILQWSTKEGDGTFDDEFALHTIYNSGPKDLLAGKVDLILTAYGKGVSTSCDPAISILEATFLFIPKLVITDPAPVCLPETIDLSLASVTQGSDPDVGGFEYFTDLMATIPLVNYKKVDKAGTYYIRGTNLGGCKVIMPVKVTFNKLRVPSFSPIAELCLNSTAPQLEPSSQNYGGISGTWFPNKISTDSEGDFYYKFTPTPGQCARDTTLTVKVSKSITPTFSPITICDGELNLPSLPLVSTNGIIGTWNPAVISAFFAGPYLFTPVVGGCAVSIPVNITITPMAPSTFSNFNTNICLGSPPPTLPAVSDQGSTGTWVPATINTSVWGSSFYTFTPNSGGCVGKGTLAISVNQKQIPQFDPVAPLCHDSFKDLPIVSKNGISGKWSPSSVIDTKTPGIFTYRFVPDATSCAEELEMKIEIYNPIVVVAKFDPITSIGGTTTVTVTASGGSGNYISGTGTFVKPSGTYTFTVKDDRGCEDYKDVYIPDPQQFDVTAKILTAIPCFGGNAKIQAVASGGTAKYTYKLFRGNQPFTSGRVNDSTYFVPASVIPYQFEVTDAKGLFAKSDIIEITDPPKIELTASSTPPTCAGEANGTATVIATLGAPPYVYLWNDDVVNPQKTATATGLKAGKYKVQVKDQLECYTVDKEIEVSDPPVRTLLAGTIDPKCFGETGTILFSFTNVIDGLYDILYDGGKFSPVKVTNNNADPIAAPSGDYKNLKLIVNGCGTAPVNATVKSVPAITFNKDDVLVIQPTCATRYGRIVVQIPAPGSGYEYSKNDGLNFQLSNTFNFLDPATYQLRVRKISTLCVSAPIPIVILPVPAGPALAATGINPAICGGDGSIVLSLTNVTDGTYEFVHSSGSFGNFVVLGGKVTISAKAGTYTDLRYTADGCPSNVVNVTLVDPAAPAAPLAGTPVQPDCVTSTGSVQLSGLPLGAWTITSEAGTITGTGTSTTVTGLLAGNYHFTVTNAEGCLSAITEVVIDQQPAVPVLAATGINPASCGGDGSIVLSLTYVTDGIYTINYSSGSFSNVSVVGGKATIPAKAGVYSGLKITANGCPSNVAGVTLFDPAAPAAPIAGTPTQPNCTAVSGSVLLSGLPSTGTWTITSEAGTITGTGTSTTVTGLPAGNYHFTVTNTLGCTSLITEVVINTQPSTPADLVAIAVLPECEKSPIQTLNANSGIVPPPAGIVIRWYDGSGKLVTSPILNNPGTVTYLAEAFNENCASKGRTPVTLTIYPAPVVLVSQNPYEVCAQSPVQTIDARTVVSVLPGVTLKWYDTAVGGTEISLPVWNKIGTKIYYTETFSGQCPSPVRTKITLIIHPLPDTPELTILTPPTCNNPDGTVIVISPLGAEYVYSIDGGAYQASVSFTGQVWGNHFIRAKNINTGCESAPGEIKVPAIPPAPELKLVSFENPICYGDLFTISLSMTNTPDGVYNFIYDGGQFSNVTVSGGTATITGQFTENFKVFNNLRFTANDCNSTGTVNVRIVNPAQLDVLIVKVTEQSLKGIQRGAIDISATGGTGKLTYAWSNLAITQDLSDISFGDYKVTVTDDKNCIKILNIKVPLNNPPVAIDDNYRFTCLALLEDLLANDYDPDPINQNDFITINTVPVIKPLHAQAFRINRDGTFEYLALPGFNGIDFFVYEIADKYGQTSTAKVTITVVSDLDGDGIADTDDPDADGDGILNIYEALPGQDWRTADADGDGNPNYLDIDADGDGIPDNIEAQGWANYIHPSHIDVNNNGVDDAYDKFQFTTEIVPIDTDGDGIPDFLDSDSDNDGVPDYIEGHDLNADGKPDRFALSRDSDGDGLDDAYDTVLNECNAFGNAVGSNAPMQDFDGDGLPDWRDDNDDNDGFLTKFEDLNADRDWSNDDLDYDGHPEYLDYGRDCDLFIPDAFSPNGDNIHDYFQIYCINHFPDAKVYIFDQLGNKLFEKAHYGNLDFWLSHDRAWWNGKPEFGPSKARNEIVPPGTYYYVLDLGNGEVKKSFLFISY